MKIVTELSDWQRMRKAMAGSTTIGFIPSMGNLHRGHLSLFEKSLQDNVITVGSIFVNPTQFNQQEDYLNYPKTLANDIELLRNMGVDYCLLPAKDALYHDGYCYQLHENEMSRIMEGKHRPGHFIGVLTIVMKLLQLVKPNNSYFGLKDYQQFKLIQGMVRAFFMDVEVIGCPIIREASGLALSSRNNRLSFDEKDKAHQFASIFHQKKNISETQKAIESIGVEVEYIEEYDNRRFIAVKIGDIRLIDNFEI